MDAATIQFNYENAIAQANELDSIAKALEKIPNDQLPSTISNIKTNWTGDNATAYINKVNKLSEKTKDTVSDLKKAAASIRQIAKNIYDAEMRALRIAQERSYKKGK